MVPKSPAKRDGRGKVFEAANQLTNENLLTNNTSAGYKWVIDSTNVTGSLNPFDLALNPTLTEVKSVNTIANTELVAIINLDNQIKIYPYKYISHFECINDVIDNNSFIVTYCPLTQSAISRYSEYKNDNFIFRASGYLYKDNLVAYDKNSDTYWSQMLLKCIKGKYENEFHNTFNVIETTWETVKNNFPEALVFTDSSIPLSKSNSIIRNKYSNNSEIIDGEKVYGILDPSFKDDITKVNVYKYSDFEGNIKIFNKYIDSKNVVIIGSKENHFITSYIVESSFTFQSIHNEFPLVMEDNLGNVWNVFGEAVSGPDKGKTLSSPKAFVALGWAWKSFYSDFILE